MYSVEPRILDGTQMYDKFRALVDYSRVVSVLNSELKLEVSENFSK